MPEYKKVKKDRAYTHEEIHKLLQIADERLGVIILLMASSGIRIGALSSLRLRNLDLENRKYPIWIRLHNKQDFLNSSKTNRFGFGIFVNIN